SKDIYAKYINKNASDQKQIFVGKVLGVIIDIGLLLLAWYPPATLYQLFILKFELLIQIAPAFIIGLYWKRMHAGAVFTVMLVSTVGSSCVAIACFTLFGVGCGLWGLIVSTIMAVILSLILKQPKEELVRVEKAISSIKRIP